MKDLVLAFSLIFCSLHLAAQKQATLAIINDPDGFTYVRSGPGKDVNVVDTLNTNEFFYFTLENDSDWAKVHAWKGSQTEGFVHKSRIQQLGNLSPSKQKQIILFTLETQLLLSINFQFAFENKDSLNYITYRKKLERFSDCNYSPVTGLLPEYFCATKDIEIVQLLLAVMWADKGSANEAPAMAIGGCFACEPDLLIEQIRTIKSPEQKEMLLDQVEFGLINLYSVDEHGKSDSKEYNRLITKLNAERKTVAPK
jgi:hypothetical protein